MLKGHYWMLVLDDQTRVYVPMLEEDEAEGLAIGRWIEEHETMVNRQRNRERQAAKLRASILYAQACRPSAWWKVERARNERAGRKVRR